MAIGKDGNFYFHMDQVQILDMWLYIPDSIVTYPFRPSSLHSQGTRVTLRRTLTNVCYTNK